ncbi:hypothetical protein Tco_1389301 [Tanacetum coccineum]
MGKTGLFKAFDSLFPLGEHLVTFLGNGYSRKGRKMKPKRQNQARECEEREKSKATPEKSKVKPEAKTEEILNGPPLLI